VVLIPLFFYFIIAAQLFRATLGYTGAAILAGALFAIAVYTLSLFERRWYLNKTSQTVSHYKL
jgi:hypothetical protein